jgi:hypothetical protein
MAEHIPFYELENDIRSQMEQLRPVVQLNFLKNVVGPLMISMVLFNFLRGKNPEGKLWKSWAKEVKFGGRWSKAYKKRPSGSEVTADKTRLTDTGDFQKSYKEKEVSALQVTVGPTGDTNEKIAEHEELHGNVITGWGQDALRALTAEIQGFVDRMALGKPPQTRPISTAGRRAGA